MTKQELHAAFLNGKLKVGDATNDQLDVFTGEHWLNGSYAEPAFEVYSMVLAEIEARKREKAKKRKKVNLDFFK